MTNFAEKCRDQWLLEILLLVVSGFIVAVVTLTPIYLLGVALFPFSELLAVLLYGFKWLSVQLAIFRVRILYTVLLAQFCVVLPMVCEILLGTAGLCSRLINVYFLVIVFLWSGPFLREFALFYTPVAIAYKDEWCTLLLWNSYFLWQS